MTLRYWIATGTLLAVAIASNSDVFGQPVLDKDRPEPFANIPLFETETHQIPSGPAERTTTVKLPTKLPLGLTLRATSKDLERRAAEVIVVGTRQIDRQRLVSALQSNEPIPWEDLQRGVPIAENVSLNSGKDRKFAPAWPRGENIKFGATQLESIQGEVRRALAHQGFARAKFRVEFDAASDAETVNLLVTIESEGPRTKLGNIVLQGLSRHTSDDVLSYLDVRAGEDLNAVVLNKIYAKLRDSCRFITHSIRVTWPVEPDRYGVTEETARVVVTCLEYEEVPKLGTALTDDDQVLVKAATWMNDFTRNKSGEELVVQRFAADSPKVPRLTMIMSPDRGWLIDVRLSDGEEALPIFSNQSTVVVTRESAEVIHWARATSLALSVPMRPECYVRHLTNPTASKPFKTDTVMNLTWQTGPHIRSNPDFRELQFHTLPICFVHQAHLAESLCTHEGEDLVVKSPRQTMRINRATGALKEVLSIEDDSTYRVSVQNGAFARLEQQRQLEKKEKGVQSIDSKLGDSKVTTPQDVARLLQQMMDLFTAISPNTFAPESNEAKN